MKQYHKSLFVFRRDLRLEDNTALLEALKNSKEVILAFILDPRQVKNNPYKSDFCVQFMFESLEDLSREIKARGGKLYVFQGEAPQVVHKLIAQEKVDAVYVNRDYTPFSVQRDLSISYDCEKAGVRFYSVGDYLLHEPEEVSKGDGGVYTVYTHFYKKASTIKVREAQKNKFSNYYVGKVAGAENLPGVKNSMGGGRSEALKILKKIAQFKNYDQTRNLPAVNGTTRLSAHHKFGTVSIREVYWTIAKTFGHQHTLIKELYWRDFFTHVGFHHPYVLGESFHRKYDRIKWSKDEKVFQKWCEGKTGFPIVDAGMRELNATGFMHNRVRMIVASFLVKDLLIDWRWGEKYFAQKLVDYDPLVNNGNWQWAASTGCDAQPYFRIFNPWLQQERFDPDCVYIKKWVPELKNVPVVQIHGLENGENLFVRDYPKPMVNHKEQSARAKEIFKSAK